MDITVILCTYNRCGWLARALESAAHLELPGPVEWEVLVVDNNSTDRTRAVVADFSARYPGRFRYVFEKRQGKSFALNTGIRESKGEILAFMDDDVVVDAGWLRNLTGSLHDGEWAGAGGRILPEPFVPPRWLSPKSRYASGPLVIFDKGDTPGELKEPPYGTNMAFRKKAMEKHGAFRSDLDRHGASLLGGEDTEYGLRLLARGERLRYEPSAIVYHSVPETRLQRKYFLAWWRDKARSNIRTSAKVGLAKPWSVGGIPLYLFRRLAIWSLRWMFCLEPARRFENQLNVWIQIGGIVESFHQARKSKPLASQAGRHAVPAK